MNLTTHSWRWFVDLWYLIHIVDIKDKEDSILILLSRKERWREKHKRWIYLIPSQFVTFCRVLEWDILGEVRKAADGWKIWALWCKCFIYPAAMETLWKDKLEKHTQISLPSKINSSIKRRCETSWWWRMIGRNSKSNSHLFWLLSVKSGNFSTLAK